MLFNAGIFLKAFLPLTLLLALLVQRFYPRQLPWFLIAASLVFYGWWSTSFLALLLVSASVNYLFGKAVYSYRSQFFLVCGIVLNLLFLGYFKYAGWLLHLVHGDWKFLAGITLPLAISFYTFEQISYLVDCRKRIISPAPLRDYLFFVTFFPKLIAGPIVRFAELRKQISQARVTVETAAIGLTLFILGLCKKTFLADSVAHYVAPVFDPAKTGAVPSFADAWLGALAYSLQIYFDFSGYCDMAVGLAIIFNIYLPINFYSPYKATSIIEFWRRWHMTLSRFLRDYLYFPLGGSRRGKPRQYMNLLIVMGLGGLWHGAGLTFIIWGFLHGAYLVVNHCFRQLVMVRDAWYIRTVSWLLTFVAVVVAWVFFRAESVDAAWAMISGMAGQGGGDIKFATMFNYGVVALLMAIALLLPNSNQFIGLRHLKPDSATDMLIPNNARESWLRWVPSPRWAVIAGLGIIAHVLAATKSSPFLYFQF